MLKELTARKDRCGIGQCPGVYEESPGKVIIVGAQREVANRVGSGEVALEIDRGLVSRAMIQGPVSGMLRRTANLLMRAGL